MGEAGRTGTPTTGQPRNGFVLKEFLQRESDLNDKHYTMIQNTVHRLVAKHLDTRCTWRENQGDTMIIFYLEVARLHPCIYYDYDAFWSKHDQLKQHLKSTNDKYNYIDPDLDALYQAEEAAKEANEPPPRRKQHTTRKGKQRIAPRSLSPSSPPPFAHTVNASQPLPLPQQSEPRRSVHPKLVPTLLPSTLQSCSNYSEFPSRNPSCPFNRSTLRQRTPGYIEIEICNSQVDNRGAVNDLAT